MCTSFVDAVVKNVVHENNFRFLIYWASRQVVVSIIRPLSTLQKIDQSHESQNNAVVNVLETNLQIQGELWLQRHFSQR